MSYTLQIGSADPVPLASLGIRSALLTSNHQGDDTLTITLPRRIIAAGLIPAFTKIILRENTTIRFIGWRDREPRAAAGASQNLTCVINGPWRWMNRKYFTPNETGAYILGRPASGDETHQPVWEIINFVLAHAKTASGNAFTYTALTEAIFNVEIPWRRRHDDLCGTILRSLFAYLPTAALRWSYATETPNLEIYDTAGASAVHTLNDTVALSNLPILERRDDLLRDTVTIKYTKGSTTVGSDIAASAGDAAALGADFDQLYTFGLGENEPVPAPGLAAKLAAWHQKAHVETALETRTIDWTKRAGEIWAYAAGSKFDQWSSYTSICQQITRDLFARKQTVNLGVPAAPSTYRLSKSDPNNDPEPEEPKGTLEIEIAGLPEGLISEAKWSTGEESGAGESSVDLAPGNYNVEFLPVYDFDTGTLYFAPAAEVTIVEDETATATGAYETVELAALRPFQIVDISAGETKKIKVRPSTIFEGDAVEVSELTVTASGFVWVAVPFTPSTGAVGTGTLSYGSTIPDSTSSSYIVPIGTYTLSGETLTVANYRYGPITGFPCRNWYADPVDWTLYIN